MSCFCDYVGSGVLDERVDSEGLAIGGRVREALKARIIVENVAIQTLGC